MQSTANTYEVPDFKLCSRKTRELKNVIHEEMKHRFINVQWHRGCYHSHSYTATAINYSWASASSHALCSGSFSGLIATIGALLKPYSFSFSSD